MPKKYLISASGSNNTKALIPYKGVKNNYLFNGKSYVGGLKIQGIDIFAYDLDTQASIFNNFGKIINNINKKISIVKIAVKNDIEENQKFLEKQFESCKVNANEEICEGYYEDLNLTFEGQLKFNYFIIVYGFEIKELDLEILQIKSGLSQMEIQAEKLKIEELLDVSLKVLNSNDKLDKKFANEIVEQSKDLEQLAKSNPKMYSQKASEITNKLQSIFALGEIE